MKKIIVIVLSIWASTALAQKPDLFLLKTYDDKKSVVGWLLSEKLDGVRGYWNGKELLTRGGHKIYAPEWFLAQYPPFAIDGELWTKRSDFETISSIVSRHNPDKRWRNVKHYIFEVPKQQGGLLQRLAVLENYLADKPNTPIRIVEQKPIKTQRQVKNYLAKVVKNGGEGLVVRNPKTPYKTGRLNTALKVKTYRDTECVVLKILPGKGKYKNKMGSLLCEMNSGQKLKIGTGFSDKQRAKPPVIGTTITFKYYGFTKKGKPKYATFLKIKAKID